MLSSYLYICLFAVHGANLSNSPYIIFLGGVPLLELGETSVG